MTTDGLLSLIAGAYPDLDRPGVMNWSPGLSDINTAAELARAEDSRG